MLILLYNPDYIIRRYGDVKKLAKLLFQILNHQTLQSSCMGKELTSSARIAVTYIMAGYQVNSVLKFYAREAGYI